MAKAIRVTVTKIYQYIPDPTEDAYTSEGANTIEEILAVDIRDYTNDQFDLSTMVSPEPDEQALWEIVEDNT